MFAFKALISLVAVLSGLGVILSPQAVHSALFLTCNLLCVAVLYLTMSLHFLGAAQMVIYAGAIMVVFLFAVTVLAPEEEISSRFGDSHRIAGLIVTAFLGATLAVVMRTIPLIESSAHFPGDLRSFAAQLFGRFVFAFEGTAFILLVALIGIVLLGYRRLKALDRKDLQ